VGFSSALIDVVPETKSAQRPKSAASSMRVRTSLPRSIRPRETPTSAHLGDAEDRDHALGTAMAVEVDRPTWPKVAEELRSDLDHLRASPRTRPPLGSRPDLDLDRVERLAVASLDQGEEGSQSRSAGLALTDTLRRATDDRWRSGTAPTPSPSCVRMRPSERGWSSRTEGHRGRRRSDGPG